MHENGSCADLGRTCAFLARPQSPLIFWFCMFSSPVFVRAFLKHIQFSPKFSIFISIYRDRHREWERKRENVSICLWYAYVCAINMYVYIKLHYYIIIYFIKLYYVKSNYICFFWIYIYIIKKYKLHTYSLYIYIFYDIYKYFLGYIYIYI